MSREIREYEVFKKAHHLVLRIYEITSKFPVEERYGLTTQMRRSAYSITMNLIEGGARQGESEFRHFVNICRGSCAEIQYQLELVRDLSYITNDEYKQLNIRYDEVGKMLTVLMKKLSAKS